jgi:hypothetical protein
MVVRRLDSVIHMQNSDFSTFVKVLEKLYIKNYGYMDLKLSKRNFN